MTLSRWRAAVSLFIAVALATPAAVRATAPATAPASRPADEASVLIRDIEAMTPPTLDPSRLNDVEYRETHGDQMRQFERGRNDAIQKLYARFPANPQARKLMLDRWLLLARRGERDRVITETDPVLVAASDPSQRIDLLYVRAEAIVWPHAKAEPGARAVVEDFVRAAPRDERGAELLYFLAETETNPREQAAIYRRAAADPYTTSPYGKVARGKSVQADAVGKPFDLSFTDAITGKPVSVQKDFKGKIVVIDFWATWCGPCRAQMLGNQQLYAEYKNRGVAFVGVSLDQPESEGGLKALKDYVAENQVPWPQYYQGHGLDSEFSSKWGVDAIPTIFVVGRDGKLATANASGKLGIVLREMVEASK